jgi:hypothetical protein
VVILFHENNQTTRFLRYISIGRVWTLGNRLYLKASVTGPSRTLLSVCQWGEQRLAATLIADILGYSRLVETGGSAPMTP